MANQYVTATDFDALVDPSYRTSAFVDSAGDYDSAIFDRAAELASALIQSAAANAGYAIPDDADGTSTSDDMVKLATLSILIRWAYDRQQQEIPAGISQTLEAVPEQLRVGDLPLTSLTPDTLGGVGGSKFTSIDPTDSTSIEPVFDSLKDLL